MCINNLWIMTRAVPSEVWWVCLFCVNLAWSICHCVIQDAKVVESASLALTRIAETLQHSPQHLSTLCSQGLISNTLQLISVSETGSMTSPLEVGTYFGLIKLLTTCVSGSAAVAESLHEAGTSKIIQRLLSRYNWVPYFPYYDTFHSQVSWLIWSCF